VRYCKAIAPVFHLPKPTANSQSLTAKKRIGLRRLVFRLNPIRVQHAFACALSSLLFETAFDETFGQVGHDLPCDLTHDFIGHQLDDPPRNRVDHLRR
jgi:hypothetical protein